MSKEQQQKRLTITIETPPLNIPFSGDTNCFLCLPYELIYYIFTCFLYYHEAISISRTCKLLYVMFEDTTELWKFYRNQIIWSMARRGISKLEYIHSFQLRNLKYTLSDKEYIQDYHCGCIHMIYLYDDDYNETYIPRGDERYMMFFCKEKNYERSIYEEMKHYHLNTNEIIMKIGPARIASKMLFILNDILGPQLSQLTNKTKPLYTNEKIQVIFRTHFFGEPEASFNIFLNMVTLACISTALSIPFYFPQTSGKFSFLLKCRRLTFEYYRWLSNDVLELFTMMPKHSSSANAKIIPYQRFVNLLLSKKEREQQEESEEEDEDDADLLLLTSSSPPPLSSSPNNSESNIVDINTNVLTRKRKSFDDDDDAEEDIIKI